ncbi:oligosaccharide flippase family protein [Vogesella sp. DC21W]|uniref:Oligosaccharide flippase family protein n=1 Tax=Vogesella aquatica TaxID=2984206 RepID=A0ABT5IZP4_9NEIS|nr:oligosaccharide flippase family protein [Vogesella aquatica]MDC7717902.1 oligosaccharide flippase family protein [Vogesella aquatica]
MMTTFFAKLKNPVILLMLSTVVSQIVPLLFMPWISRVYSPGDFGAYGAALSIISFFGIAACLRYELAIALPKSERDARLILIATLAISTIVSIFSGVVLFFLSSSGFFKIIPYKNLAEICFVVLGVGFVGAIQSLSAFANRVGDFKSLAISRIIQNVSVVAFQIGFFYFGMDRGLYWGYLLGQAFFVVFIFWMGATYFNLNKKFFVFFSVKFLTVRSLGLLRKYSGFLKYDLAAALLNTGSSVLVIPMIGYKYGIEASGLFFLVQRVISAPVLFVSSSLADVFRSNVSKKRREGLDFSLDFLKMLRLTIMLAIAPAAILMLWGEMAFIVVFGAQWAKAGALASVMAMMMFFRFSSYPLSFVIVVMQKQKVNFFSNALTFVLLLAGFYFSESMNDFVRIYVFIYSLFYFFQIIYSAVLSGVFRSFR